MAKKGKRKNIGMVSVASGHRRVTRKNVQNTTEKLEKMMYDPNTRQHEKYVETKKNLGRNEA